LSVEALLLNSEAHRSAGGAIFAVDEVMTRKVRNAFVATAPVASGWSG